MEEEANTIPDTTFSAVEESNASKSQTAVTIENKLLRKWMIKNMVTENTT